MLTVHSGIDFEALTGWCWGFVVVRPTTDKSQVVILADNVSSPWATWAFPANVPAKILFSHPIHLDRMNFLVTDEDSASYTFYILLSASPKEIGL